jgi:hypothetical protein
MRDATGELPDRFRRHADDLAAAGRSPLSVTLMRSAAQDLEPGGRLREVFAGIPLPPGSVPALRLLSALHHLVLSGRAPELAEFYPSVGGFRRHHDVWPVASETIDRHAEWIRGRLGLTVQTNEPGRAAVLFAALLWLVDRRRQPIRLLEIGASAGLNLLADRFCYLFGTLRLGTPDSPVRFPDPWSPPPPVDLALAGARLEVVEREGCDAAPLDPADPEDRMTVLSYIWPDEIDRIRRTRAALDLASREPRRVVAQRAEEWLPERLEGLPDGMVTVLWQSVVRQYLEPTAWDRIDGLVNAALADGQPLVWLRMEPSEHHVRNFLLTLVERPNQRERLLARCGDHGPPVSWVGRAGDSPA